LLLPEYPVNDTISLFTQEKLIRFGKNDTSIDPLNFGVDVPQLIEVITAGDCGITLIFILVSTRIQTTRRYN